MRTLALILAALAAGLRGHAQESRPLAPLAADRAELLRLFDGPGGLGVIQVAEAAAPRKSHPLFPRYAGFPPELAFQAPAPTDRLEALAESAGAAEAIEAPGDLRDALGALPAPPPGATHLPSSLLKAGAKAPAEGIAGAFAPAGPAGWLVLTRRSGAEIRPLKTSEDVSRWAAAAELQRRAYEALLLERFTKNLGGLGTPAKNTSNTTK